MSLTPPKRLLIGLVGHPLCGKDTASAYLVETHGFTHVSSGDIVRAYVAKNGLGEPTRELMREVSNQLRTEHGADYLVRLALENPAPRLIISAPRAKAEAQAIIEAGGHLVALSAPLELRYERAKARKRVGEDITLARFQELEEAEAHNPDPNAQNVAAVIALATHTIHNTGSIPQLQADLDQLMGSVDQVSNAVGWRHEAFWNAHV